VIASLARRAWWSAFTLAHAAREKELPFWPLERIIGIQRRRLRAIIRHAYEHAPFYRDAMRERGLSPADIRTAEDLARLPLTDSAVYGRQPERFRPAGGARGTPLTIHSSGTTGGPRAIDYDARALFLALAHGQRQRHVLARFTGRTLGYRELNLVREGGVPFQIRAFLERHSWTPPAVDLKRKTLTPGELPLEEEIEEINRFQPTVLMGYGSYLGVLFGKAHRRGLRLMPKVVVYGADLMADSDRALIEDVMGVPVVSTYQAAEALRIGFQCELRRGFHLSLDDVAVRVVDERGQDVSPGGRGQLVVSNLTNFATVLLNYRLGDVVTLGSAPCPRGRTLPVIESIDGRADDLVHFADGRSVHALQVVRRLRTASGLDRLQVIQMASDRFVIRAVAGEGLERTGAADALAAALNALAGRACQTELEWVEALVPEPSGKTRIVISRWKPDELAAGG